MAKKREPKSISTARRYSELLLYEATGGTMGKPPQNANKTAVMTFGEKRGLLDSLIKIAILENKVAPDDESDSGFNAIKKEMNYGGTKSGSGGNPWGVAKDSPDDESDLLLPPKLSSGEGGTDSEDADAEEEESGN